jgi:hypothetical protein
LDTYLLREEIEEVLLAREFVSDFGWKHPLLTASIPAKRVLIHFNHIKVTTFNSNCKYNYGEVKSHHFNDQISL